MSPKKKRNRSKPRPGGPPRQAPVVGTPVPEGDGGAPGEVVDAAPGEIVDAAPGEVVEPDGEPTVSDPPGDGGAPLEREPTPEPVPATEPVPAAEPVSAVEPVPVSDALADEPEPREPAGTVEVETEPVEVAAEPVEDVAPPASADAAVEVEPEPVEDTVAPGAAQEPADPTVEPEPAVPSPAEREPVDDAQPYPGTAGPVDSSERAWRRLGLAARPRPTKANVLATLLAIGLGFAIAAQVRQTSIEGLEDLREDELIRILDTVDQDGARLAEEIQTLRFSRDRLQSDTTSLTESRRAAQQRLDSLAILTGTAPAKGPGIVLTIRDPEFGVTAPMLLDTLQELRDAGAEAVEINDVRIVANTYFTDGEGGIAISGKDVSAPYVITAIGDGSTLASAMEIPGGVTNTVRSVGGEASIETKDEVTVSALQSVSEPQYARPIPSPTKS